MTVFDLYELKLATFRCCHQTIT